VAPSEGPVAEVAGAILDGASVDWDTAESSADLDERPVLDQLRLLATVADIYRGRTLEYWGHLRVLERIGRGAFGDVYRAWDPKLDREVALKLLPESEKTDDSRGAAIIEEGRLLARVRHPNVVTIYGADRIDDRVGLWMELVKGRTLQQAIEQGKQFPAKEVEVIGIELCHAVAAVHGAGLLHRDIKPHNVMLADDGRIVLMDFGTGRELSDDSAANLAGTPLYLAPELLSGQQSTVRSDIYSLGVLLYHLLTGSYPVRGRSLRDLRLAHERRERADLRGWRPGVARKLVRVVERAIDPDPARRYHTVAAMERDLAALKSGSIVRRQVAAVAAILVIPILGWETGAR
jgi:serine/threonine-protein kinase